MHAAHCLASNSANNHPVLSPVMPSHNHSHYESAFSHLDSPLHPLNFQHLSEVHVSPPHSPPPRHHCKACMSLLKERTKEGQSLGHTHLHCFSTSSRVPTSPLLKPPVTLPLTNWTLSSCTQSMSSSHFSPPSQPVQNSKHLFEGGDLTLLNHCLHHIVGRRTSSPTLQVRGPNCPPYRHMETISSFVEPKDKSQDTGVLLDKNPLFSLENQDRSDQTVGQRTRLYPGLTLH